LRENGRCVVMVPTMGDLHAGHLELVRIGRELGEVIVSVFVNPTQFAPGEDFERYPRQLASDREALIPFDVSAVFAPAIEEIYPEGDCTWVEVERLSEPLCGQHRPGHFRGVTTVCTKLFTIVRPDVVVFGQKDAQQCLIIHRLLTDLRFPIQMIIGPTVRQADGLALSSRNRYLEGAERDRALGLSRALAAARARLESGERRTAQVELCMVRELTRSGIHVDYAELRTVPSLQRRDRVDGRTLLAVAARVGTARLLDNLCLHVDANAVREAPLLDECTVQAAHLRRSKPKETEQN
jgi:pantoate--beta-alanine ligase